MAEYERLDPHRALYHRIVRPRWALIDMGCDPAATYLVMNARTGAARLGR